MCRLQYVKIKLILTSNVYRLLVGGWGKVQTEKSGSGMFQFLIYFLCYIIVDSRTSDGFMPA